MKLQNPFTKFKYLHPCKLGTKHPWVKDIQVCSNKEPRPYPREDDNKITKIY